MSALRKPSGHARDLVGGTFRGADAVELDRPVVDVVPRDLVALDEGAHVVNEHREVGRNLEVSELVEDRYELAQHMRGVRPSLWVRVGLGVQSLFEPTHGKPTKIALQATPGEQLGLVWGGLARGLWARFILGVPCWACWTTGRMTTSRVDQRRMARWIRCCVRRAGRA